MQLFRRHTALFLREYGSAVLRVPQLFRRLAFRRRTLEEELQEVMLLARWGCRFSLRLWAPHYPRRRRRRCRRRQPLATLPCLQALLRGSLRKAFGMFDLLCLGLGIVIGSGWTQLTGSTAQQYSG